MRVQTEGGTRGEDADGAIRLTYQYACPRCTEDESSRAAGAAESATVLVPRPRHNAQVAMQVTVGKRAQAPVAPPCGAPGMRGGAIECQSGPISSSSSRIQRIGDAVIDNRRWGLPARPTQRRNAGRRRKTRADERDDTGSRYRGTCEARNQPVMATAAGTATGIRAWWRDSCGRSVPRVSCTERRVATMRHRCPGAGAPSSSRTAIGPSARA